MFWLPSLDFAAAVAVAETLIEAGSTLLVAGELEPACEFEPSLV